jgi:hypothetical protein
MSIIIPPSILPKFYFNSRKNKMFASLIKEAYFEEYFNHLITIAKVNPTVIIPDMFYQKCYTHFLIFSNGFFIALDIADKYLLFHKDFSNEEFFVNRLVSDKINKRTKKKFNSSKYSNRGVIYIKTYIPEDKIKEEYAKVHAFINSYFKVQKKPIVSETYSKFNYYSEAKLGFIRTTVATTAKYK